MPDHEGENGATVTESSRAVFLSYASEDAAAARRIADTLRGAGIDVWFDQEELRGGDTWDQKIRRQIRDCRYFLPLISAQTEARLEGYFRREWRLAVERTLNMADDYLFLLPVVIDDTGQGAAHVPEKFQTVQWLRAPGGEPTPALLALCQRLAGKEITPTRPAVATHGTLGREGADGQRTDWQPDGWRSGKGPSHPAWAAWKRLPRWIRVNVVVWTCLAIFLRIDRSDTANDEDNAPAVAAKSAEPPVPGAAAPAAPASAPLLLALPFVAPEDDAGAQKFADGAFATVYGKLGLAHPAEVTVSREPLAAADVDAAVERGRAARSKYVLAGFIRPAGKSANLDVTLASVEDGAVVWNQSFPVTTADPAGIATQVDAHIIAQGE
jgi:TolB-like protein